MSPFTLLSSLASADIDAQYQLKTGIGANYALASTALEIKLASSLPVETSLTIMAALSPSPWDGIIPSVGAEARVIKPIGKFEPAFSIFVQKPFAGNTESIIGTGFMLGHDVGKSDAIVLNYGFTTSLSYVHDEYDCEKYNQCDPIFLVYPSFQIGYRFPN